MNWLHSFYCVGAVVTILTGTLALHSTGGQNDGRYSSPEVDALLEAAVCQLQTWHDVACCKYSRDVCL